MNKFEATLDNALMSWLKKGFWIYNASNIKEFSVDEVKFQVRW
jgi:hypothetical protein